MEIILNKYIFLVILKRDKINRKTITWKSVSAYLRSRVVWDLDLPKVDLNTTNLMIELL